MGLSSTLRALSPPGPDLRVEVPAHLSVLSAPGVLHLVLGNLIGNARQHASGSLITVRSTTGAAATKWPQDAAVRLRGGVVLLTVSDEGPGIADDQRLFEPFATGLPGEGIGLWLCRLAVRAQRQFQDDITTMNLLADRLIRERRDSDLGMEINDLLDAYRARHGITSDEKLAARLGVSGQAIYRWRIGQIDRSARALLTMDRDLHATPEYSTAA